MPNDKIFIYILFKYPDFLTEWYNFALVYYDEGNLNDKHCSVSREETCSYVRYCTYIHTYIHTYIQTYSRVEFAYAERRIFTQTLRPTKMPGRKT
jgi:hypothetical protein